MPDFSQCYLLLILGGVRPPAVPTNTGADEIGEMIWIIADGPLHSSQSQIAFPSREQLSLLIEEAGLEVERWMSDGSGAPRSPQAAEIIPLGRLR